MTSDFPIACFQVGAAMLRRVAVFCLTHGSKLYADWSEEKLFKYLAFQWLNGCLFVAREGGSIEGILIAWPDRAAEVVRRQDAGELHFNWQRPIGADALMVADVIVSRDLSRDRRRTVTRLVQMASARWPDWKMRKVFTHRRGKLVELTVPAIERLARVSSIHS